MSLLSVSRKRLNTLLKKLLLIQEKGGKNLLNKDPTLTLQTALLLADYDIQVGTELRRVLDDAVMTHLEFRTFTIRDLSYLALCSDVLSAETLNAVCIALEIQRSHIPQEEMERVSLAFPDEFHLDEG